MGELDPDVSVDEVVEGVLRESDGRIAVVLLRLRDEACVTVCALARSPPQPGALPLLFRGFEVVALVLDDAELNTAGCPRCPRRPWSFRHCRSRLPMCGSSKVPTATEV